MLQVRRWILAVLILMACPWSSSRAGVYFGYRCGGPFYRPYYGGLGLGLGFGLGYGLGYGMGGFYRPYPLYVASPPVVVQQPPIVVQQPVVAQPAYPPPAPAPAPIPAPLPAIATSAPPPADVTPALATAPASDVEGYLRQLRDGSEQARADALIRLGRLKAGRAVGAMIQALKSDASPSVREAAARGLGLIAAPSALTALQYAAQSDDDREVRHSAAFAAEVIRGNLRRN